MPTKKFLDGDGLQHYDDIIKSRLSLKVDKTQAATDSVIGLVKPGDGLEVSADGTIGISDIEQYAHFFDTVADMKGAANLVAGDYARTLGYHSVNDGGDALYKIEESSETADGGSVINLSDGLQAKLIPINGIVNVKQFGAVGDDSTDDTTAFANALAFSPRLNIPHGSYKVAIVAFPDNAIINGNNSTIDSFRPEGDLRLNVFGSNSVINDLTINSLNEDREWNRIHIENKSNIVFNNCTFSGFRHAAEVKNAWGVFLKGSERIVFNSCYFYNNNFQDIIIEVGCRDIVMNDCDGDDLFIDVEPGQNASDKVESVTINRCNIDIINLYENFLTSTSTRNVSLNDCVINTAVYDGQTVAFNNCIVKNWGNETAGTYNHFYAGNLKLSQSICASDNLVTDPYFDDITSSKFWTSTYSEGMTTRDGLTSVREDGTNYTVINPSNLNGLTMIISQKVNANAGDKFLIKISGKAQYPNSGTSFISDIATIRFYDSNNTAIESDSLSAFRSVANSSTPKMTQSGIIVCPEGTVSFDIRFRNCRVKGTNKLYLESCQLFKISSSETYANEVPDLPARKYRNFEASTLPIDSSNYTIYRSGDTLTFTDPVTETYIGAVCTADNNYVGVWKKYGSLEP